MLYDYGYFHGSRGMDKDEVDCYLGPNEQAQYAYVVKQMKPHTNKFDEVKVMLGFNNEQDAKVAYEAHYNKPGFFGGMTKWHTEVLRRALKESVYDPMIIKTQLKYIFDIEEITKKNTYFRKVIATGKDSQLVVMDIKPGEDVGEETHKHVEQSLFLLEGKAQAILDNKVKAFNGGEIVIVPPGTKHNIVNIGKTSLKICTIYTPPNHIAGRIHKTKAEAMADIADEKFGEAVK